MSGKLLLKAYHVSNPSTKKRVALLGSDSWEQVLAKLQTKFAMPALPILVEADGAAVESVDELCDGDELVVHGPTGAESTTSAAGSTRPAASSAVDDASVIASSSGIAAAVEAFYKRNMLHTAELVKAVQLVRRFVEFAAKPDPKYRRVSFATKLPSLVFAPPITGVRELLVALGYTDEDGAETDSPSLVLPAGVFIHPVAAACLFDLEQRLLPYVMHVALTSAGSSAVKAVQAGLVVPKEGSKDAGGALRASAARGGADAMERLEEARRRLQAVSAAGFAEAEARGFLPPDGLERDFHDAVSAAKGGKVASGGAGDDEDESADAPPTWTSSAAAASGAGPEGDGATPASREVLDREALRTGMSLFRHLSQASSGRGRLEELAMRLEARAGQAEERQNCTVRLDLPSGRRVLGVFRLDEPVVSVERAAKELCAGEGAETAAAAEAPAPLRAVRLRGAGGAELGREQCLAAAASGDRIALRVTFMTE